MYYVYNIHDFTENVNHSVQKLQMFLAVQIPKTVRLTADMVCNKKPEYQDIRHCSIRRHRLEAADLNFLLFENRKEKVSKKLQRTGLYSAD